MEVPQPGTSKKSSPVSPDIGPSRSRLARGRKRRHVSSESSSDIEPVLPENLLEVEKNLHASAVKNNLDDVSVKKILKKVVTNDHVLALVKLREEEENMAMQTENLQPKLTRSKVKELMKVSPKTAWNLENMELTPIKHIPVKTRPEVTALIAQELHDDEDDDEYQPTHDDVPSDDDHTLESCSDVDSQPRTPATPRRTTSPRVLKDGPFKVPQDVTPRRKLDMDEDATIALRTRSKLSLSSIPIDHIENSFVPPDELPMPVDDVWTEFLQECLNPETEKEVDDEDDPEYNVAADPDAHDEDEEGLENIIKISKKELNDLVTELFNVMPPDLGDEVLSGKLASEPPAPNAIQPTLWEGKQEVLSDDETPRPTEVPQTREKRLSIGKNEPVSDTECQEESEKENQPVAAPEPPRVAILLDIGAQPVTLSVLEGSVSAYPAPSLVPAPAPLKNLLVSQNTLTVQVEQGAKILPEQILILQQQIRQHIQLASSNFLQLFVHPVHWSLAPTYKEYLETLTKITTENPKSVANVCNLKPAMDLIISWEKSVSADTPENAEMVEFIQKEIERGRRRAAQNSLYVGDFHKTFLKVVANSPVFLYPHLLPPLPYRSDGTRRFSYMRCEDELITLGIDEFWQYVEENPELYKLRTTKSPYRWGLVTTVGLVCKHMFPWIQPKAILSHITHIRKLKDVDNPLGKYFASREVTPVQHTLLPFNPNMTLYEQPEYEMPRIWVRYLAKTSKRFRDHYYRRTGLSKFNGNAPTGVPVQLGNAVEPPTKKPLPIDFADLPNRAKASSPPVEDNYHTKIAPAPPQTTAAPQNVLYSVVQTPSGAYLIPLTMLTTTNSASTPITTAQVQETVANNMPEQSNVPSVSVSEATTVGEVCVLNSEKSVPVNAKNGLLEVKPISEHCKCCIRLRKICKVRQALITDYFVPRQKSCPCKEKRKVKYPRVSKKLRLLSDNYKAKSHNSWKRLLDRIRHLQKASKSGVKELDEAVKYDLDDIVAVTTFHLKLTFRTAVARNRVIKRKLHTFFSRFNPECDNACTGAMPQLEKILATECVDMYKEFFGFLTMEQADQMGKYLYYFQQECLNGLMDKIEELVTDNKQKHKILSRLSDTLTNQSLTSCEICLAILDVVDKYPALAEYVFSLFPHRKDTGSNKKEPIPSQTALKPTVRITRSQTKQSDPPAKDKPEEKRANLVVDDTDNATTDTLATDNVEDETCDDTQTMYYEADHSSSDEERSADNLTIVEESEEINQARIDHVKNEEPDSENLIDTPLLTITKTEVQDHSEASESDMSMMIMSEDDIVKTECPEWRRDEDKLVLEVLQRSLSPEEMKDKTILEIIEQKKVLELAAQNLPEKSLDDVRERMLYLLEFLVMNELNKQ